MRLLDHTPLLDSSLALNYARVYLSYYSRETISCLLFSSHQLELEYSEIHCDECDYRELLFNSSYSPVATRGVFERADKYYRDLYHVVGLEKWRAVVRAHFQNITRQESRR